MTGEREMWDRDPDCRQGHHEAYAMGPPERWTGSDTAAQLNVLKMVERVSTRRANDPKVDVSHVPGDLVIACP